MVTLYITHPAFLHHQGPAGHPERPDRLRAVEAALSHADFAGIVRMEAPLADIEEIVRAHPIQYVEAIRKAEPAHGIAPLDPDTYMSPGSFEAARRAVGAAILAVDTVLDGGAANAFCAVRPPGHHAERTRAMGFCLFNSVAVAACHARHVRGLDRVAIVDFDVHHGNGTQDIFWSDRTVLYASVHQMPLYPGTGSASETGAGNIFNVPLRPGDGSEPFRKAIDEVVLPALANFRPDLVIVSAGFDGHMRDPLAQLRLTEDDFAWVTHRLVDAAERFAGGRLVSSLEGGYDLTGLAASVTSHVKVLMES